MINEERPERGAAKEEKRGERKTGKERETKPLSARARIFSEPRLEIPCCVFNHECAEASLMEFSSLKARKQ
jgi:hypothetical protein